MKFSATPTSKVTFWFIIASFITFSFILAFYPATYRHIAKEDSLVEYAGALSLLFCAFILVVSALKFSPTVFVKFSLWLVAIAFFLAAGEEISWGQRLFGWQTPEALAKVNDQDETNFHNINKKFFDKLYDRGIFLLFALVCILRYKRKQAFFGIPLPSTLMVLCFCLLSFYRHNEQIHDLSTRGIIYLLAGIVVVALLAKARSGQVIYPALALAGAVSVLMWNEAYLNTLLYYNSVHEVREYLFGMCCLALAYEQLQMLRSSRPFVQNSIYESTS